MRAICGVVIKAMMFDDDEDGKEGNDDEWGGGGVRLHNKRRSLDASSNKTECHAHVTLLFAKSINCDRVGPKF